MIAKAPHQMSVTRMVRLALAPGRSSHDRQRELVRASLLARPATGARRSV